MTRTDHETGLADGRATAVQVAGTPNVPALRVPAPRSAPGPAPARRRWLWALGLLLAGGAGAAVYLQPWAEAGTPVAMETVALAPVTRVLAVNGRIAARHSVDVRALVGGRLEDLRVAEGDAVERGAEVARIDAAAQRALLRQAIAGLDGALVSAAQAQDTLTRTEALGDNVPRTALETATRAVQSATQEVARTTAQVEQAQVQLETFVIRAPMTGTVLALNVDEGQSLDLSTVLMTIADLGQLVVETDVDEAYATQIRAGLPVVLQLAGESVLREGSVGFVSQRVDAATGGLAVTLTFDEPVTAPVGLTVTANIIVAHDDAALTAPRAAITTGEDGAAVFVVIEGMATRRRVSVIDWPAARLIVTEGLAPGELLISDATGISAGQAVRRAEP